MTRWLLGLSPAVSAAVTLGLGLWAFKPASVPEATRLPQGLYVSLGWLTVALSIGGLIYGWRRGALTAVGVGSWLASVLGVGTFALALVRGQQDFFDAYPLVVLMWAFALPAAVAMVALLVAARRGGVLAQYLRGVVALWCVLAWLPWTWTWSEAVQDLAAWVGRTVWLSLHG